MSNMSEWMKAAREKGHVVTRTNVSFLDTEHHVGPFCDVCEGTICVMCCDITNIPECKVIIGICRDPLPELPPPDSNPILR